MHLIPHCFLSTVTTAATRERLTESDIKVPAVLLQAEKSNTGAVYIGDNQVSSTNYGVNLAAGDSVTISSKDFGLAAANISLKDIWLDVGVSTDGVSVLYMERFE
jgi:hypothetical protein